MTTHYRREPPSSLAHRLCPAGTSGLVDRIDGRVVQLRGHVKQEEHQIIRRQILHWRGGQQQSQLRILGTEVVGFAHGAFSPYDNLV